MVSRQSGERIVHYDPGAGVVCRVGRVGIEDPHATTCGHCLRTGEHLQAWREAERKVRA